MKKISLIAGLLICVGFCGAAEATLIDRGSGLIYDDDLDITWLQNADFFGTGSVARSWSEAVSLVASLTYQGFDDWRLPSTPGTGVGFLNEGELGHLYYSELGNVAGGIEFNPGPFVNIQRGRYWTGRSSDVNSAFAFFIAESVAISGLQDIDLKGHGNNIWAVRDGDIVRPVPEPTTLALMTLGLAGIGYSRRKTIH